MSFWDRLLPRDLIAMLIVVVGCVLLLSGINGLVGSMLLVIVSFYFGSEIFAERVRGVFNP